MSILRNINYIKKLNAMPCSAPNWYVLLETGFASAAPALLSLGVPGCTDIVKLKLGISPWHRKGIRSLIKKAEPPFAVGANKFLYKIGYFTAERALYYLMVADIAVEFVATWESLARVAQQCPLPSAGTAYGTIAPFVYTPGAEGVMQATPVHGVPGVNVGLGTIVIQPGFQGVLTWSAEWDSWPTRGQGVNVSTWTEEEDNPVPILPMQTNVPPSQPKNQTAGHLPFDTTRNFTGHFYRMMMQNNGDTFAQPVSSTWSVALSGHPTGQLPWGCKLKETSIPFT